MQTVIFDIDGTLADIEHRRGFLDGNRPDWRRFNAAMGEDAPNLPIVNLYRVLWASGVYDLQIVTGRNEAFRKVTETWLTWNEMTVSRWLICGAQMGWRACNAMSGIFRGFYCQHLKKDRMSIGR